MTRIRILSILILMLIVSVVTACTTTISITTDQTSITTSTTNQTTSTSNTGSTTPIYQTPTNIRIQGDYLLWDAISNASAGYTVEVNGISLQSPSNLLDMKSTGFVSLLQIGENLIRVKVNSTSSGSESAWSNSFSYTYALAPQSVAISGPIEVVLFDSVSYLGQISPDLANQHITWSVDNPAIAEISATGELTTKTVGFVTIRATSTNPAIFATLLVEVKYAEPTAIVITGDSSTRLGSTPSFSAQVLPQGANQAVSWSVNNIAIATVNTVGLITTKQAGEVILTATSLVNPAVSQSITIQILFPELISLSITGLLSVAPGNSITLSSQANPNSASNQVIWSVNNPAIATIDAQTGRLTGVSNGVVTVRATSIDNPSIFAEYQVTIAAIPVERLTVFEGISQMTNAETVQLRAIVTPSTASQSVQWSSSHPEVATIDSSGIVTPLAGATGTVVFTATSATDNTKVATFTIRIIADNTTKTVVTNYTELVAALNGTATYIVLANDIDASGQTFNPTRTGFNGVFDGQGFAIINLKIQTTSSNAGLFKQIGGYAVIKDVIFVSPTVFSNSSNTALIAGQINSNGAVTISNVVATNMITTVSGSNFTHGGFIAHVTAATQVTIVNSYIEYQFVAASNNGNVGGFVGVVNNNSNAIVNISNSVVNMTVNATAAGQIYGGAIGQVNVGTSTNLAFLMVSLRNVGTQNALVNGGLLYSQLNTSGNNHFIQNIAILPGSDKSVAFVNNNGNSQINGASTNTDLKITAEINPVLPWLGERFVEQSNVWAYNADINELRFLMPNDRIQEAQDVIIANRVEGKISIANPQNITSDLVLQTLIDGVAIEWTSSNFDVISNSGQVIRPQGQNQTVIMSYQFVVGLVERSGQIAVTVIKAYDPADEIIITITGPNQVATGQSISLQISVEPLSVNPAVTWSIKDQVNGIVSINQNGVITGLAVGSVTIVATLNEFPNKTAEYVVSVILAPEVSVSVLGGGLLVNNPTGSQVRVQANMAGTLVYVQDAGTLSAAQVLASANKRSVSVSSGSQDIGLTISSGVKLHFVLAIYDGESLIMTSSVVVVEFNLLSATVFVSNYTELVAALNRTDNVNIVLTADITATGNFTPTRTQAFVNTFDGAGFKIINFALLANASDSGMFRNLGANAIIKNVTFIDPRISTGQANVGLLAGRISQAGDIVIQNVKVIGLETTVTSSQWGHGGLIGTINTNNANVLFEQIYLEYKFQTASSSVSSGNVGGLVGTQFNTSTLTVRHAQIVMSTSFANTGNTGQIIGAVVGQVNTGTTTNIAYVYAGIRNVGPGNPLSNAGIVYSQMNNAGTNHTISNIIVMSDSTVVQVTSQITTINGTNSKTNTAITNEFHLVLTETLGNRFVSERGVAWKYVSETNTLSYRLLTDQEQTALDVAKANEVEAAIVIANPDSIMDDLLLPTLIQGVAITWESSNPAVVSILGEVTRPSDQDVSLTLTYHFTVGSIERSGSINITVLQIEVVINIELDILGLSQVAVGQTITLTTVVTPNFVPNQVVWSVASGSETLVSITQAGVVMGLSSGSATIVATLVEDSSVVTTHEVLVYLHPTLSVSVQGNGLSLENPAQSVVSITTNMGGRVYYVQHATNQTPQQILDSSSKQAIDIPLAGTDTFPVTITSGTKLQFILVTYNGQEVGYVSSVFVLTFTLLSNAVMVSNYDELVAALNRTDDVNIVLTANITATGNFTPSRTTAFISTFDGQGYTITGLSLVSNGNDIGMFRRIGGGAVIKNIVFESPRISTGHANSGLIAGRVSVAGNILIENIIVKDLVTTVTVSQWTHGGLIGLINTAGANVTVNNIYLTYTFQTTNSSISTGNMGGIVGVQSSTSTLSVSHVYSDVIVNLANANNTGQIIAAIIGQVNTGTTSNVSYVMASVRNTGVSANAIINAGLVYSQLNTAGNNHTISNIMIHPLSTRTVAFVNNNGNSQVNGATTNNAVSITNQMLTVSASNANLFVQANSNVWSYHASTNELNYILPQ